MCCRISALFICLLPAALSAQTVFFHLTDGTTQSFAITDIRKLTFLGDEQVLWLNDGTQYTWNVSTIGQYEFQEDVGIEHIASGGAPLRLHLYPNPANAEVALETELPQPARLVVDIMDLQGRVVRGLYAGERPAGGLRLLWDAADDRGVRVAPGTYLVRMATPWGSSTKPVVLH
jgi:flagellar hook assembly protein FlgD